MCKQFGPKTIAWLGDGTEKDQEIQRFRNIADGTCAFLVAGLKMICQSMDLIESNVFTGLEAHPINAEVVQAGHRQYRIGQQASEVIVDWLIHSGSEIETEIYRKNLVKDKFAEECKRVQAEKIKEMGIDLAKVKLFPTEETEIEV